MVAINGQWQHFKHKFVAYDENAKRADRLFHFPFPCGFPSPRRTFLVTEYSLLSFSPRTQLLIHFEKRIHIFTTLLSVLNWCVSSRIDSLLAPLKTNSSNNQTTVWRESYLQYQRHEAEWFRLGSDRMRLRLQSNKSAGFGKNYCDWKDKPQS